MGKLAHKARTRFDYLAFLGAREWPVLVSALGVLLGAVTILPSAVGIVVSVVALLLGTITFVRDVRSLRKRWAAYEFTVIASPFPRDEVPAPAAYPGAAYLYFPNRGTALVSDRIDKALQERSWPVEIDEQQYRLPARLKATAPYVLPLRARGRLLFNGSVMGMRSDPLPQVGEGGGPIMLHRAKFFDTQCSNELCSMRITRRDTGEEFDPRRHMLIDTAGRVRTLAESELADAVGVSTIAFTSDGHLVLVRQSDRNAASPLLLAPSGSGSLEPRDLAVNDDRFRSTLQNAVCEGMERELCEETGLPREKAVATKLVGFARWMERGAKPEFLGVTTLSMSSDDVRRRRPSGAERLYSSGVSLEKVDLAALGRELLDGTGLLSASSLPVTLRDDASLPLLLALRAAAIWTSEHESIKQQADQLAEHRADAPPEETR